MTLEKLSGVGPARAKKLRSVGVSSVDALAALEPDEVVEKIGVSQKVAQQLVISARESVEVEESVATWKVLAGILVVGLLLLGVYSLFSVGESSASEYTYNGFTFVEQQCSEARTCWVSVIQLNIGAVEVPFYYGPRDVEDVPVDPSAVSRVLDLTYADVNGSITLVFDAGAPGELGVAASNLARVTGERLYNIPTSGSEYNNPVSCADSSDEHVVIYFTDAGFDGVSVDEGGCVILSATSPEELLRVSDAYRLHLLRVMH